MIRSSLSPYHHPCAGCGKGPFRARLMRMRAGWPGLPDIGSEQALCASAVLVRLIWYQLLWHVLPLDLCIG